MSKPLYQQSCHELDGPLTALDSPKIEELRQQLQPAWQYNNNSGEIVCRIGLENFYHTMAFANAVAWIANQQDHHPTLELSYKQCEIRYTTHSVGGLSIKDFICAAKIDQLLD